MIGARAYHTIKGTKPAQDILPGDKGKRKKRKASSSRKDKMATKVSSKHYRKAGDFYERKQRANKVKDKLWRKSKKQKKGGKDKHQKRADKVANYERTLHNKRYRKAKLQAAIDSAIEFGAGAAVIHCLKKYKEMKGWAKKCCKSSLHFFSSYSFTFCFNTSEEAMAFVQKCENADCCESIDVNEGPCYQLPYKHPKRDKTYYNVTCKPTACEPGEKGIPDRAVAYAAKYLSDEVHLEADPDQNKGYRVEPEEELMGDKEAYKHGRSKYHEDKLPKKKKDAYSWHPSSGFTKKRVPYDKPLLGERKKKMSSAQVESQSYRKNGKFTKANCHPKRKGSPEPVHMGSWEPIEKASRKVRKAKRTEPKSERVKAAIGRVKENRRYTDDPGGGGKERAQHLTKRIKKLKKMR